MKSLIGGLGGLVVNKTPVSYAPSRSLRMPWAGGSASSAETQMRAMGSVSTLFAIVNRTSNATSQVNWRLWRTSADGRRPMGTQEETRTEVTRHAALDLWRKPNPFMTGQELVEIFQQHLDLVGEGVLVIGRNPLSPLPLELWPVRPDRITPVPHPTNFLAGYVYTGPDGDQVPLGLDEVIHLKMPNPLDPYRGLGPVQAAMVDLDSARYSAEWNRAFFVNSAEPGGVVEIDKTLDDDEFNEMNERWREQHQGVDAAHRVAFLEGGAKWKPTSFSQRDMQFVELRGVSREIIREAFGIHGHMLGNSQDVNKANAEAGEISFARWLVFPRAQRIKQVINTRLLPLFGDPNLEFDHDRVVPEDREADDRERTSRAQSAQLLVTAGYDPADVARAMGLPEMGFMGGDTAAPDDPARALAEMIQKIYLGVDTVVTWDEARAILNRAGADLPAVPKPEPPALPSPGPVEQKGAGDA